MLILLNAEEISAHAKIVTILILNGNVILVLKHAKVALDQEIIIAKIANQMLIQ